MEIVGRKDQLNLLQNLFDMNLPVFVWGGTGSGKTMIVRQVAKNNELKHAYINCIEHHAARGIYESALNQLHEHVPSMDNNFSNFCKCDDGAVFTRKLNEFDEDEEIYLIVDNAEKLIDSNPAVLSALFRLDENTRCSVCVTLISTLPWGWFEDTSGYLDPVVIHFPNYTTNELVDIMCLCNAAKENMATFRTFALTLVKICSGVTHYPSELVQLAESIWPQYYQPVRDNKVNANEASKLYSLCQSHITNVLQRVHLRCTFDNDDMDSLTRPVSIELPRLGKFLLIATYLASFLPQSTDFRTFAGRSAIASSKRKRQRTRTNGNHDKKLAAPGMFTLERVLAITYAISDDTKAQPTALIHQVNQLVYMRLVTLVTESLEQPRYRCNASPALVESIATSLGITISGYMG